MRAFSASIVGRFTANKRPITHNHRIGDIVCRFDKLENDFGTLRKAIAVDWPICFWIQSIYFRAAESNMQRRSAATSFPAQHTALRHDSLSVVPTKYSIRPPEAISTLCFLPRSSNAWEVEKPLIRRGRMGHFVL